MVTCFALYFTAISKESKYLIDKCVNYSQYAIEVRYNLLSF